MLVTCWHFDNLTNKAMTKKEKIVALSTCMTTSKRAGEEDSFHHFSDMVPKELVNLFLESYSVRDIDYETFSRACDIVSEIYTDKPVATDDEVTDDIYERASGSASVYTSTALSYLDNWNQDEIADMVRELNGDIAQACMYWYDRQVQQAAIIIKDWVNA